jgi:hypothetical protein
MTATAKSPAKCFITISPYLKFTHYIGAITAQPLPVSHHSDRRRTAYRLSRNVFLVNFSLSPEVTSHRGAQRVIRTGSLLG